MSSLTGSLAWCTWRAKSGGLRAQLEAGTVLCGSPTQDRPPVRGDAAGFRTCKHRAGGLTLERTNERANAAGREDGASSATPAPAYQCGGDSPTELRAWQVCTPAASCRTRPPHLTPFGPRPRKLARSGIRGSQSRTGLSPLSLGLPVGLTMILLCRTRHHDANSDHHP